MNRTKILIVDDREANLVALEKILKCFDIDVIRAFSGNEALQLMIENEFALILMDVQMPDMDGFETVNIMREDSSFGNTPVIFISAIYRDEIHSVKGIESGAVDFIVKPIIQEVLVGKVRIFLNLYEDRKRLERELILNKILAEITNSIILPQLCIKEFTKDILDVSRKLTGSAEGFVSEIHKDERETIYHVKTTRFSAISENSKTWEYLNSIKDLTVVDSYNEDTNLTNMMIVPISYNSEVIGQIVVANSPHEYLEEEIDIIQKIANLYTLAINRRREEEKRLKLEENIRQAEKMQAIGQLVGGIAHDFNNVLCGIMSASQLLNSPLRNLDDKSKKYVGMILKASNRAVELIQKLMTFGRKKNITFSTVDINDIIDGTLELLNRTLNNNIVISQSRNGKRSKVNGNHSELESVFINICINAGQAMAGGGEIDIITNNIYINEEYCRKSNADITEGEYISINIKDSGCGIKKEDLHKIFEPFFTTKDQGEGSGLGLAIVYGTVKIHNGEILVESVESIGTTVSILLPCIN